MHNCGGGCHTKDMKVTNLPGHDSWILLFLLGTLCLGLAPVMAPFTARLAGLVLVVLGLEQSVEGFRRKTYRNPSKVQPSLGMIEMGVGMIPLLRGGSALILICAVWGVFGLFQAAHALNHVICAASQKRLSWWKAVVAVLEIWLALELIFSSGEAIILHVRLLGLELLTAAWAYRSQEQIKSD